ncbi:hypothetical protein WR25_11612 [Diploscapter pachys]|uniref:C-type lectin domain-containing protein n=1 Tax=Diploscapter pachys TaxID=2018661 RepID=A0A2A2KR44_9BILA|nr:hypothetical protein WR25_11612 [Diploscapter pachys]
MHRYSTILLLALAAFAYGDPCGGSDWKYNPRTNACYKLLREILPWTVAEFKCLFQGAHHASIESWEENQFVSEVAQHMEIWTGAAYFGSSPAYVNSDQKPYGHYINWKNGRTPLMNRARRCIKMNPQGYWFQSCCKKKTYSVCKKAASGAGASSSYSRSDFASPETLQSQTHEPETTTVPYWYTTTTTPYWYQTTTTEDYWKKYYATSTQAPWVYSTTLPYWLQPTTYEPPTTRPYYFDSYRKAVPKWERTPYGTFKWIPGFRVRRI